MQTEKKDIRALTKEQLRDFFVTNGDKAFRGNQVYEWLWHKRAHKFEDMTNVSKHTREMLEANFVINHIKVDTMQRSSDGTVKNAVRLHDDLIVDLSLDEPFENPQEVIRGHPEHRRAEAAERIERHDGFPWSDVVTEAIDEVDFGCDRPDAAFGAVLHRVDDVFSRAAAIGGLHDIERALGMGDYLAVWILLSERLDLRDGKPRVDRAVPFPEDELRLLDLLGLKSAPDFVRIPHDHFVERHPHLVGGVPPEMLVRQHHELFTVLPRPLHHRSSIRRGADDAAVVADEGFDRG